jgi:hypothetical protein
MAIEAPKAAEEKEKTRRVRPPATRDDITNVGGEGRLARNEEDGRRRVETCRSPPWKPS